MGRRSVIPAFILALALHSPSAHAAEITINSQAVELNGLFSLEILVSNVTDLYAFSLDLSFDPTVVALKSVLEGSVFLGGDPTLPCTFGGSPLIECSVDDPARPSLVSIGNTFFGVDSGVNVGQVSGVLVVLMFEAVGFGDAGFQMPILSLSNSVFAAIDVDELNVGQVNVVPEPSTIALLGVGLAAMARRFRSKRRDSIPTT